MGTNTGLGTHPSIGPIPPLILPASKCKSPCDLDSFQEGETFYFILATVNSTKRASNSNMVFSKFTLGVKDANA